MPLNTERTPTETEALDRLRFVSLIKFVLEHEGGYVNDPQDPGGETNFGISKRTYPTVNIKALTIDQAAAIYYQDWWKRLQLNKIDDDLVAQKVLDTCVNVGPKTGIKLLQIALKERGHAVPIDGFLGPKTIEAVNKANSHLLLAVFRNRQAGYYRQKIDDNPSLAKYARGWQRRAYS